jgi:hypothetical protein
MKRLRVRFRLRTMMVVVAIIGVACVGGRELWRRWRRPEYWNPVSPSHLSARAGSGQPLTWRANQPTPVTVTYDFKFGSPKSPPGTTCKLLAEVWFEDQATGRSVDGYSFDALLTAGGREAASGTFIWEAELPGPGRYFLRYFLSWYTPAGKLQMMNGGGTLCRIVAAAEANEKQPRSGELP